MKRALALLYFFLAGFNAPTACAHNGPVMDHAMDHAEGRDAGSAHDRMHPASTAGPEARDHADHAAHRGDVPDNAPPASSAPQTDCADGRPDCDDCAGCLAVAVAVLTPEMAFAEDPQTGSSFPPPAGGRAVIGRLDPPPPRAV